jgi:outer membrane protein with beta-barrel domain
MKRRVLALLIVLAPAPALAGGFELALLAGYTSAGALDPAARGINDLSLQSSFTWGASGSYFFSSRFGIEGSWAREQSGLEIGTPDGRARMFDVQIDQLHGSVVWRLGPEASRVRPFMAAGLGASLLTAPLLESETKLSLSLAGGARWMPTPRAGARLQVRYTPIHLNDSQSSFCDPFGFCQGWLHQLELTGGVVVGF